ncbi:GNAT family N-acetyltransferase [Salisediminibacterium beveridgei]|uniref:Ribosomal-protein-L7p-serine acetyltransferase n=1 Tax=Salisediminibacterium beveridgei TaxID=632773 RepID=A0A1D7QZC6_9BACI|nr:GNAT family protein [Salisediminibacterium beveridgei]AOM84355.1 Ribosomal-protein-L7p-serine acetyltransferase [Salisediminibacterium beveridgei]
MFQATIDSDTYLALLEPRHAKDLYHIIDASRDHLGAWLAFPEKTTNIADSEAFIKSSLKRFAEDDGYWVGIWHQGQMAGSIGFLYMDQDARKTEIGYWLGSGFAGKGIATKAVTTMINHAFHNLNLNKVEINVATENKKSRAIPERLGFTQEGIIRHYEYLNGVYLDRVIYGLLQSEW